MLEILTFLLLGLAGSTLIAALSLGVVVTYRSSGVINFAAGANAGFVAYVFWALTSQGVLFLGFPIRILPEGEGMAPGAALAVSVVVAAILGLLQYVLVYRFLRTASALARIVASSGVLLVLQASMILSFDTDTRVVAPLLRGQLELGVASIGYDVVVALSFTLCAVITLTVLYQKTRFGVQTRAAADNRTGALFIGVDPDRLEAVNWTIASVLMGIVGVLVTPMIGLQPTALTLYIVPVLGAALVAKFVSFWVAAVAGLLIGSLQALVTWSQGMDWFPRTDNAPTPGIKEALPFVIIAIILLVRGHSLPGRASEDAPRLPGAPRPQYLLIRFAIGIVLALGVIAFAPYDYRQALVNSLIGIVAILSIVVVTGYLGAVNLAQMAVAGVAGFVLSKATQDWGLPGWLGVLVAITAAVIVSLVVALPAMRLRGMQFAIITLAGAVAIQAVWFNNPYWGGGQLAATVDAPEVFGIPLGPTESFWEGDGQVPSPGFAVFLLVVTVLCAAGVVLLRRSNLGAKLLAVRGSESAAASAGINLTLVKLVAFAIGGLLAGVSGILYGYNFGLVSPMRFTELMAISMLAVAFLGGITTVTGAVIAGLLVSQGILMHAVTSLFGISSDFQLLFAGLAVLVTVVANPSGIAGFFRDLVHRFPSFGGNGVRASAGNKVRITQ
ncbi:ABC transporter permease [Georgenia sp. EYE_87]|uniref:ABC transporter permease n=1 Tax=Georgenia sp. EYE_87 TaxID=2853448 RepID=UPI002006B3DB|nr:ABC transporter permease [Georgenia sp. EYE_87]MCK6212122.1 ABC transporter permease [Georgenia sp. EYE_87]